MSIAYLRLIDYILAKHTAKVHSYKAGHSQKYHTPTLPSVG